MSDSDLFSLNSLTDLNFCVAYCLCIGNTDMLLLLGILYSFLFHFPTKICTRFSLETNVIQSKLYNALRMMSICGQLLALVIWRTLLQSSNISHSSQQWPRIHCSSNSLLPAQTYL